MERNMRLSCYNMESLGLVDNQDIILDLRPCPVMVNTIAVTYLTSAPLDINHNGVENGFDSKNANFGLILFEVGTGWVTRKIEPFLNPETGIKDVLFSNDYTFCLDESSRAFELMNGEYIGEIFEPPSAPKALALNGSVVVYYKDSTVYIVRLSNSEMIGQCEVHSTICSMKLCYDDRTLIIGCEDGTVLSYIIIDQSEENPEAVLCHVSSRTRPQEPLPVIEKPPSRSWDKVDLLNSRTYSRPPSVMSAGPMDRELLKKIRHVPRERPKSDTQLYAKSAVCSVM